MNLIYYIKDSLYSMRGGGKSGMLIIFFIILLVIIAGGYYFLIYKKANSGTTAPVTTAPVTTAPGTTAPGTTAPVTTAPGTTVPVTTAPVTTAPGTTVPVTTAPVTTAPVTTAPVTTAPPVFVFTDLSEIERWKCKDNEFTHIGGNFLQPKNICLSCNEGELLHDRWGFACAKCIGGSGKYKPYRTTRDGWTEITACQKI
jgi:hypothetical protein